jgi:hypothetical protein
MRLKTLSFKPERGLGALRKCSPVPAWSRELFEVIPIPCFRAWRLHRGLFRMRATPLREVRTRSGTDPNTWLRLASSKDSTRSVSRCSPRGISIVKVSVTEYFFEQLRSVRSFFRNLQIQENTHQACCEKIAKNDFLYGEASGVMFLRRTLQEYDGHCGPSFSLGLYG